MPHFTGQPNRGMSLTIEACGTDNTIFAQPVRSEPQFLQVYQAQVLDLQAQQ